MSKENEALMSLSKEGTNMETQNRDMKPIRVTLTTTQIVDLVAPQALDPIREADDPQARAVVRRTVEALDRLGLIVREAK